MVSAIASAGAFGRMSCTLKTGLVRTATGEAAAGLGRAEMAFGSTVALGEKESDGLSPGVAPVWACAESEQPASAAEASEAAPRVPQVSRRRREGKKGEAERDGSAG